MEQIYTSEKFQIFVALFILTRISGPHGPFIPAPADGWWMGLWPITWAIQSMDDEGRRQGRYPENFVLISQLEVCQEWGVKKRVLGGH